MAGSDTDDALANLRSGLTASIAIALVGGTLESLLFGQAVGTLVVVAIATILEIAVVLRMIGALSVLGRAGSRAAYVASLFLVVRTIASIASAAFAVREALEPSGLVPDRTQLVVPAAVALVAGAMSLAAMLAAAAPHASRAMRQHVLPGQISALAIPVLGAVMFKSLGPPVQMVWVMGLTVVALSCAIAALRSFYRVTAPRERGTAEVVAPFSTEQERPTTF